ncbi:stalk domain-containing protein [Paenibacillus sp. YYML68]|uniref:stalk domain-containing protein n=1 Tax=Paenibacillus sp. YYML68 TaxID=2909250 RepID=UPI0024926E0E|nr:stalk domain-containing protein [Paenibacillus sp. YYML68]
MNKVLRILLVSGLAAALATGGSASAASLLEGALLGADQKPLLTVDTAAGTGQLGSANGAAASATFRIPAGLAVKADGTVYIADSRNHEIRAMKDGKVELVAGTFFDVDDKGFPVGGMLDGQGELTLFTNPHGISLDKNGNLYVADSGNHAIRKIDASGNVTTLAGDGIIGLTDDVGGKARFYQPLDVAVADNGTVYVADTLNHVIRRIATNGQVTTLNAPSTRAVEVSRGQAAPAGDFADGELKNAKFNEPSGLVLDAKGNLYVSDSGNQRIRYIDLQQQTVTTVAGGGQASRLTDLYVPGEYADGPAAAARFHFPIGLALTDNGGIVVADSQNHSIRLIANGQVTTVAGTANQTTMEHDGVDRHTGFHRPVDVAVLKDGSLLVADAFNNKLRHVQPFKLPANLPQDDSVKVVLNNDWITFDAQPEITNGRTMVPVGAISEALGYKVTFDDATRAIQLIKDDVTIELYVDRTGIKRLVEGERAVEKETDAAPYMKQGRTYVPVRFFAEEIGLDVQWDGNSRTAIIRTKLQDNN